MTGNGGYRDEESECNHGRYSQSQSKIPTSHAAEGNLLGCLVLLMRRTALVGVRRALLTPGGIFYRWLLSE